MRKNEMRVGSQYTMQRGPTKRPLKVTLLAKDVPSAMGNRVMVSIEEGVGTGKEIEAPSSSISPIPGSEPMRRPTKKRPEPEPVRDAPFGWKPKKGEQVTWEQTLAIPMTVIEVDVHTEVAVVEGKMFGGVNRYDAPVSQLCPINPKFTPVDELPVRRRKQSLAPSAPPPNKFAVKPLLLEDEELIDRLTFAPELIAYYRNKFARRKRLAQAEAQLRQELEGAEARRKNRRQYLTLTVPGKYEIVLRRRPRSDRPHSCYVRGINILNREKKKKAA
jgi:hypothetical protein